MCTVPGRTNILLTMSMYSTGAADPLERVDGVRTFAVRFPKLETRCVGMRRILDVVGDRLALDAVEDPGQREEPGVVEQVLRPVDPEILALMPRPIGRVLGDDVLLFAGQRVVRATDVE